MVDIISPTPIELPPGYHMQAVLTPDDEVKYAWRAPDQVAPDQPYARLGSACLGAWNDYTAWQRAQSAV